MREAFFQLLEQRTLMMRAFSMLVLWLALICFPKQVAAAPNTDTLLGYWKFDGNASDSSGDGSTGTLSGTISPSFDTVNAPTTFSNTHSLNLNTQNGIVQFANQTGLTPISSLTFSFWLKLSDYPATATTLGGNHLPGYNDGFFIKADHTSLAFSISSGASPTTVFMPIMDIPLEQWSHLTATWDGSQIKWFLNGIEKNAAPFTGTPSYFNTTTASNTSFQLNAFPALIDEVRLYKRALITAEIADLAAGKHTAAVWNGNENQDYGVPNNWNPNVVPDPYTRVTIVERSQQPKFSSRSESMAELVIDANAGLDIGSYNLTLNDGGSFSNNGTLTLANLNTQIVSGFANDIDSGVIIITSPANSTGLRTGNTYYNLVINAPTGVETDAGLTIENDLSVESGFLKLGSDLLVKRNVNIASGGTLDVSTGNYGITVKGNWNNAGSFVSHGGTVIFMGADQRIDGSTTFYNFSKTVSSSDTLTFQAGSKQTILNTLQLLGAGSTGQFIFLRSSAAGTQWQIDPRGTRDISALKVQDSNNVNSIPVAAAGLRVFNDGNNANWSFDVTAPIITLDAILSPTTDTTPTFTGTVNDTQSSIVMVQYQVDATGGAWNDCAATDGNYDSLYETFFCTTPALPDGLHTVYFRAKDTDGSQTPDASYPVKTITIDTTPPVISTVSAAATDTGATITWTSNEPASTKVLYGLSSTYGSMTSETDISTRVTAHSVTLTGLSSCMTYHYQGYSKDSLSQASGSADMTFTTTGCDVTSPTVTLDSVTTPTNNNKPTISGTATDDAFPLAGVKYQIDGTSGSWNDCSATDTAFDQISESFVCVITTALADGAHTVYVKTQDSKGNENTTFSSVTFTVDTSGPAISNVAVTSTNTGATITWTTTESASSRVEYGTTTTYGSATPETDTAPLVTSHSISLSGLAACTTFHYRTYSKDALGGKTNSADMTFVTTGCASQDTDEDECSDAILEAPDLYNTEATSETSIKIFFRDGKGSEDHFSLEYGASSGSYRWKKSDIGGGDTVSYVVKNLDPDTKYYFRVRAVNDCLQSDWSDQRSARTLAQQSSVSTPTTPTEQSSSETPTVSTSQPTTETTSPVTTQPVSSEPTQSAPAASSEDENSFKPSQLSTSLAGALDHDSNDQQSTPFESPKEKGETRADLCKVEQVEVIQEQGKKKLKLSGKGPANTALTVYVYSEVPTVLSVTTDKNGNWSYVLDKTLDDGQHQVYVAVTDSTGKISVKSEPLFFVKTAEAVRVIPPAEASGQVGSSVKKRSSQALWWLIGVGAGALVLSIGGIGYVVHRRKQFEQQAALMDNYSA